MADRGAVQQAVIGEILPDIGIRSRAMAGGAGPRQQSRRSSALGGSVVGLAKNVQRVPQSVVKRVVAGGCRTPKELRRQMEYITRDEANVASWSNQIGIERAFDERGIDGVIGDWQSSWAGAPKRGHTDHIILSFPKNTDAATAEAIAREWGQEVFGSGLYEDRFRYVAAMHHNTQHVHAHFIVDKVGMDEGKFLSINRFSEINYDMMRTLHADIARNHGLALNATPRLSRGLVENPPRAFDVQTARHEGREPHVEPVSPEVRAQREAEVRGYAEGYRDLATLASMGQGSDAEGFMAQIALRAADAAAQIVEGRFNMSGFADVTDVPAASVDMAGRLMAARDALIADAKSTWTAIQEMEPGAEKVQFERQFAAHTRGFASLVQGDEFIRQHVRTTTAESDSYAVSSIAALNDRAGAPDGRFTAQADKALEDFREGLERRFLPFADRFDAVGTSVEEMAARFASRDRTEAQLAAWRPDDPDARTPWLAFERELQVEAERLASTLPVGRALQEDLAREALLGSRQGDRLADIAALDKLVTEVRADLSDGDMNRIASGQLDPLIDRIRDPGIRSAVGSELRNLAAVEEGRDPASRDSEMAERYRNLTEAHERSADRAREVRGLERPDRDLEL